MAIIPGQSIQGQQYSTQPSGFEALAMGIGSIAKGYAAREAAQKQMEGNQKMQAWATLISSGAVAPGADPSGNAKNQTSFGGDVYHFVASPQNPDRDYKTAQTRSANARATLDEQEAGGEVPFSISGIMKEWANNETVAMMLKNMPPEESDDYMKKLVRSAQVTKQAIEGDAEGASGDNIIVTPPKGEGTPFKATRMEWEEFKKKRKAKNQPIQESSWKITKVS